MIFSVVQALNLMRQTLTVDWAPIAKLTFIAALSPARQDWTVAANYNVCSR